VTIGFPARFTQSLLLLFVLPLAACATARDSQVPPFARIPYEPISRQTIVAIALREWRLFGSRTEDTPLSNLDTQADKPERDEGLWQRIGEYWWLGLDHPALESKWTGKHDETGAVFPPDRDNEFPWSAAFVSYVMRIAGAGRRFPYAPDHAHYIDIAKQQSANPSSQWLISAERPDSYAPREGDLVCEGREEASNLGFDDLPVGHYFPSHCDIVVDTSVPQRISVVGGNEQDAVMKRAVPVAANGMLTSSADFKWLTVLRLVGVPDKASDDQTKLPHTGS
jgi:uncharacterized protein DUF2272